MKINKNEGFVERLIQISISAIALAGVFSGSVGNWAYALALFSLMVGFFASVGFCPLYAFLKINKGTVDKMTSKSFLFMITLYGAVFVASLLIIVK